MPCRQGRLNLYSLALLIATLLLFTIVVTTDYFKNPSSYLVSLHLFKTFKQYFYLLHLLYFLHILSKCLFFIHSKHIIVRQYQALKTIARKHDNK